MSEDLNQDQVNKLPVGSVLVDRIGNIIIRGAESWDWYDVEGYSQPEDEILVDDWTLLRKGQEPPLFREGDVFTTGVEVLRVRNADGRWLPTKQQYGPVYDGEVREALDIEPDRCKIVGNIYDRWEV